MIKLEIDKTVVEKLYAELKSRIFEGVDFSEIEDKIQFLFEVKAYKQVVELALAYAIDEFPYLSWDMEDPDDYLEERIELLDDYLDGREIFSINDKSISSAIEDEGFYFDLLEYKNIYREVLKDEKLNLF